MSKFLVPLLRSFLKKNSGAKNVCFYTQFLPKTLVGIAHKAGPDQTASEV